ncbi:MAG: MBL fold metallo-hydrolase [Clostridia bacterium]|nr:MBL fold metallo-hydrolase [Clostridia bacterium]
MNTQTISPKAKVYVFDSIEDYVTHVFLIEKKSRFYLIDTFCGSDSMVPVLDTIHLSPQQKDVIVINTHFHWDHVWGNCCFAGCTIISHEKCRKSMETHWETQLDKNRNYISGKAEKCLPNLTFTEKLTFCEDGIEIFYSPGHTEDCISVFDHEEGILYVGDNLEKPIIYVESSDIPAYVKTLERYLRYPATQIVSGHTLGLTKKDILSAIEYLNFLSTGHPMTFESAYAQKIHLQNLGQCKV